MAIDDEDDTWHTYALDAEDALRDIEEILLSLESRSENAEEINRLYRALHTLKGNSAIMGLTQIEALAHASEDMVGLVRDKGVVMDHALVELMLVLVDRLAEITGIASREHRDVTHGQVHDLVERVRAWTLHHGGVIKEKSIVGRGEILVWSSIPPRISASPELPPVLVEEQVAVEIFLALARDTVEHLFTALSTPGVKSIEVGLVAEDLRVAARAAGYAEVEGCLSRFTAGVAGGHDERALPFALLADLCADLAAIERRYQKCADCPQDFGMAALCDRACAGRSELEDTEAALEESTTALPAQDTGGERAGLPRRPSSAEAEPDAAKGDMLRIDARKVSLIMDLTGEIALACGAVTHHPELEGTTLEGFAAASHKLEMLIRELQNEVSAMRLVPVAGVFQRMRRVVRDTAKRTGKKVELTLLGEDTEIDKVMVDSLFDPLVHLVRNAIDHGIELPAERLALGKPETGEIVLEASHQGGEVSVRISDDGRGISRAKLLASATQRGLLPEGAHLSDEQTINLAFLPGFSTKSKIDALSGRGVGMDVVKTTIEGLRGRVRLESREGQGASCNLTVPLTLAFVEAMVVSDQGRLFALPIEKVFEVFKADRDQLCTNSAEGESLVRVRDRLIPVLWLHRFYGEPVRHDECLDGRVIVVVQTSRGTLALPVDTLLGNQPVMLKPLRGVLSGVRAAAGCGMLRTGDVALAVDCEQLYA